MEARAYGNRLRGSPVRHDCASSRQSLGGLSHDCARLVFTPSAAQTGQILHHERLADRHGSLVTVPLGLNQSDGT